MTLDSRIVSLEPENDKLISAMNTLAMSPSPESLKAINQLIMGAIHDYPYIAKGIIVEFKEGVHREERTNNVSKKYNNTGCGNLEEFFETHERIEGHMPDKIILPLPFDFTTKKYTAHGTGSSDRAAADQSIFDLKFALVSPRQQYDKKEGVLMIYFAGLNDYPSIVLLNEIKSIGFVEDEIISPFVKMQDLKTRRTPVEQYLIYRGFFSHVVNDERTNIYLANHKRTPNLRPIDIWENDSPYFIVNNTDRQNPIMWEFISKSIRPNYIGGIEEERCKTSALDYLSDLINDARIFPKKHVGNGIIERLYNIPVMERNFD